MQYNFAHNLPFFDIEHLTEIFTIGLRSPAMFASGLPFSLTLLTILMAHEMGHYLACVYHGVDATLPFFMPSPMPVTGTFGAFIRIRSAIYNKRVLFDIGIAGPIAGFIFLLPALGVGLAFPRSCPASITRGRAATGRARSGMVCTTAGLPGHKCGRHLPASDSARGVGRNVRNRAEPAAGGPTGWRTRHLRTAGEGAQMDHPDIPRLVAAHGQTVEWLVVMGGGPVFCSRASTRLCTILRR